MSNLETDTSLDIPNPPPSDLAALCTRFREVAQAIRTAHTVRPFRDAIAERDEFGMLLDRIQAAPQEHSILALPPLLGALHDMQTAALGLATDGEVPLLPDHAALNAVLRRQLRGLATEMWRRMEATQ